jgi:hypothetical protein
MMWDILALKDRPDVPVAAHSLAYRARLAALLDDAERCCPPAATVALRTVPKSSFWDSPLPAAFNAVIRELAAERGVPLLDFDVTMRGWAAAAGEYDNTAFRDAFHPAPRYTARFGTELLAAPLGPCGEGGVFASESAVSIATTTASQPNQTA